MVVDVGSGLSRVSPVHDGYILKKGITKNNLAGEAITKWMHRSIQVQRRSLYSTDSGQGKGTVVRPHYSITKEAKPEGVTVCASQLLWCSRECAGVATDLGT